MSSNPGKKEGSHRSSFLKNGGKLWTCIHLSDYGSYSDNTVFDCSQQPEDQMPILREEVGIAVAALKKGKSIGVDNIPE